MNCLKSHLKKPKEGVKEVSNFKSFVPTEITIETDVKPITEEFFKRFDLVMTDSLATCLEKIGNAESMTLDLQTEYRTELLVALAQPENQNSQLMCDPLFQEVKDSTFDQAQEILFERGIHQSLTESSED